MASPPAACEPAALPSPLPPLRRPRSRRSAYDKRTLDMIERLARVIEAMAADTQWRNQMFELVADIEDLRLDMEATRWVTSRRE